MTKAETFLWLHLKGKNICGQKFRRQFSIDKLIVDFYSAGVKLAIEVDGPTHYSDESMEHDKKRQSEIENLGIIFLRFTNTDIYENMEAVLESIKSKVGLLLAKKETPSPPPTGRILPPY